MLRVAGTSFRKICTQTAAFRILKGHHGTNGLNGNLPSHTPTACMSDSKSKGEKEHSVKHKYISNINDSEKVNSYEIKPETHREKCERLIIQAFGEEKEATKNNADTMELVAKNVDILQATTAKEQEEGLIQKIENIEDPPLVEAEISKVKGLPFTPKILGAKTTAELLYDASLRHINTDDKITRVNIEATKPEYYSTSSENLNHLKDNSKYGSKDLEEIATRCLDSPTKQLDDRILEEIDKLNDLQTNVKTASEHEVESPDMLKLNDEIESKKPFDSLALYESRRIEYDDEYNSVNDKLDKITRVNIEATKPEYYSTSSENLNNLKDNSKYGSKDLEEIATRCLDSPTEQLDHRILKEIDKLDDLQTNVKTASEHEVESPDMLKLNDEIESKKPFDSLALYESRRIEYDDEYNSVNDKLDFNPESPRVEDNRSTDNHKPDFKRDTQQTALLNYEPLVTTKDNTNVINQSQTESSEDITRQEITHVESQPEVINPSITDRGKSDEDIEYNTPPIAGHTTSVPLYDDNIPLSVMLQRTRERNHSESNKMFKNYHREIEPVEGKCGDKTPPCPPPPPPCPKPDPCPPKDEPCPPKPPVCPTPCEPKCPCSKCVKTSQAHGVFSREAPSNQVSSDKKLQSETCQEVVDYSLWNKQQNFQNAFQPDQWQMSFHNPVPQGTCCQITTPHMHITRCPRCNRVLECYCHIHSPTPYFQNYNVQNENITAISASQVGKETQGEHFETQKAPACKLENSELSLESVNTLSADESTAQAHRSETKKTEHVENVKRGSETTAILNNAMQRSRSNNEIKLTPATQTQRSELLPTETTSFRNIENTNKHLYYISELNRLRNNVLKHQTKKANKHLYNSEFHNKASKHPTRQRKIHSKITPEEILENMNTNSAGVKDEALDLGNIRALRRYFKRFLKRYSQETTTTETLKVSSNSTQLIVKPKIGAQVNNNNRDDDKKQLMSKTNANYNILKPQKDFSSNIKRNVNKEKAEIIPSSLEASKNHVSGSGRCRLETETQSVNLVTKADISRVVQQETFPKPLNENKPQTINLLSNVTKPRVHKQGRSLKPIKKDITPQYINLLTKMSQPRVAEQEISPKLTEKLNTPLNSTTKTQYRVLQQKTSSKPSKEVIKPYSQQQTKVDISRPQQETSSAGEIEFQSPKSATKLSQSRGMPEVTLRKSATDVDLESTTPVKETPSSVDESYLPPSHEKVQSNLSTGIGPIPMKNDSIPNSELLQKVRLQHLQSHLEFEKPAETAEDTEAKAKDPSKSPRKCPPKKESPCKTMYPCKTKTHNDACPPKPKPDRPKNPYPCESKTGPKSKPCDPTPPKSSPCRKCVSVGAIADSVRTILDSDQILSIPQTSLPFNLNKENVKQATVITSKQLLIEEIITEIIKPIGISNVNDESLVMAREFGPWTPMPSWPYPEKLVRKPVLCPKDGCPTPRPPKDGDFCKPTQKPCTGFPKRASFSSIEKNTPYDLNF